MAKVYTAREMREEAKCFEVRGGSGVIPAMLRQAADALERDEKREKKYEYAERKVGGRVRNYHRDNPKDISFLMDYYSTIVRRLVGEWEEVRDGE